MKEIGKIMVKIYELQKEQWAIFFDRGKQLIMQYKEGERVGRPILLANDYVGGFTAVLFEDTLYYFYENDHGELLLRNIRDNMIYYQLQEGVPLHLTVQDEALLCWVLEDKKGQDRSVLKCINPFRPAASRVILGEIPIQADVHILETSQGTFVTWENPPKMYWIDKRLAIQELAASDRLRFEAQEEKIRQMREEVERLTKLLEEKGQNLQEKDIQMKRLQGMIDSATHQYEELMHVAEQYRDEAVKWRSKFVF